MPSFCHITAIGHLTKDPDYRHTLTGSAVCELSIAYSRKSRSGQDEVTYIKVIVWGKQADRCRQYISKGSCVHVTGYLKQERWQDRNSGRSASEHKIIADQVLFIPAGKSGVTKNTGVSPEYGPERQTQSNYQSQTQPRFYGDPGAVSATSENDSQDSEEQDIPF